MRNAFFLMFCFIVNCCNLDKVIPDKEELLTERLQEIQWDEVTRYPSFSVCDFLIDKTAHKNCFFEHLTNIIQQKLQVDTLSILYSDIDTIHLKITINTDASVVLEPQLEKQKEEKLSKIKEFITYRLQNFPKVEPAQKNGVPVKTEFILPIIIKAELL